MRQSLVLPIAVGLVGAALATASAAPLRPGTALSGLTPAQAEAVAAETREGSPHAEILVSYDLGTRTYTVEAKDRPASPSNGDGGAE